MTSILSAAFRRVSSLVLLAAVPLVSACRASVRTSAEPQFIHPDGPPANPFSPAVRVGNIIFVSGTLGTKPDGTLVPGGIQPETRQLLENVKRTLAAAGVGMDRVVKCTVFLADLKEWPAMNEVYRGYFSNGNYPARTAVQATLLFGARVEMECAAAAT
ncbi:RidA family protein [Gemmatimonas groenlandica]|uniref:RidA family protein n=1 Tax=Gemmatimonas groenlandica TaxID=2732249 RepID=A0A6M4IS38_9BACT|nr:RidA family protein [Gemmatimonas groenlandica]QJR37440.1 RidA family protein [Gemmatimonas groenlandica]